MVFCYWFPYEKQRNWRWTNVNKLNVLQSTIVLLGKRCHLCQTYTMWSCVLDQLGGYVPQTINRNMQKSGNSSQTIIFFFLISCPELTAANTVDEYFTQVAFEEYMYPFWKKFHNLFFMNSIFSIKFFVNSVNRTVFFLFCLKFSLSTDYFLKFI